MGVFFTTAKDTHAAVHKRLLRGEKKTKHSYYGGEVKAGPFNTAAATYDIIREDAIRKFALEFTQFPRHRNWVITYDDGRCANLTPGGKSFTLAQYQHEVSRPYSKLTLYMIDEGKFL